MWALFVLAFPSSYKYLTCGCSVDTTMCACVARHVISQLPASSVAFRVRVASPAQQLLPRSIGACVFSAAQPQQTLHRYFHSNSTSHNSKSGSVVRLGSASSRQRVLSSFASSADAMEPVTIDSDKNITGLVVGSADAPGVIVLQEW